MKSSNCFTIWVSILIFVNSNVESSILSYTQEWLRGDADAEGGHVHEGIHLATQDGFLAVGETLNGNTKKVGTKIT